MLTMEMLSQGDSRGRRRSKHVKELRRLEVWHVPSHLRIEIVKLNTGNQTQDDRTDNPDDEQSKCPDGGTMDPCWVRLIWVDWCCAKAVFWAMGCVPTCLGCSCPMLIRLFKHLPLQELRAEHTWAGVDRGKCLQGRGGPLSYSRSTKVLEDLGCNCCTPDFQQLLLMRSHEQRPGIITWIFSPQFPTS